MDQTDSLRGVSAFVSPVWMKHFPASGRQVLRVVFLVFGPKADIRPQHVDTLTRKESGRNNSTHLSTVGGVSLFTDLLEPRINIYTRDMSCGCFKSEHYLASARKLLLRGVIRRALLRTSSDLKIGMLRLLPSRIQFRPTSLPHLEI